MHELQLACIVGRHTALAFTLQQDVLWPRLNSVTSKIGHISRHCGWTRLAVALLLGGWAACSDQASGHKCAGKQAHSHHKASRIQ